MNFRELLILAKANHPQAMETLLSMYRPLLMKEAVVNGTFDEDLYQELCNMTRLYLKLCKDDKTYSSIILGLGRMKDASLVQKMARDVFTLAYEIPRQTGLEEDFRLFTKAATDTFFEVYPDDKGLLEAMIEGPAR